MEIVETNPKQRPGLLTALCILTFIGSGLGLVNKLIAMIMSPFMQMFDMTDYNYALDEIDEPFARKIVEMAFGMAEKAIDHMFAISLTEFLLYAASLTGAILMFRMKKMGFYIYATAQVLMLFTAPIFIGFNPLINIGILFSSVFTILFIALYAINLKKMN